MLNPTQRVPSRGRSCTLLSASTLNANPAPLPTTYPAAMSGTHGRMESRVCVSTSYTAAHRQLSIVVVVMREHVAVRGPGPELPYPFYGSV